MTVALAFVPAEWVVPGGAVGLLTLVALMIYRGQLVPRRTYDDLRQDRDYWREAAMKSQRHTEALMPAARITTRMAEALGEAAEVDPAYAAGRHETGPS